MEAREINFTLHSAALTELESGVKCFHGELTSQNTHFIHFYPVDFFMTFDWMLSSSIKHRNHFQPSVYTNMQQVCYLCAVSVKHIIYHWCWPCWFYISEMKWADGAQQRRKSQETITAGAVFYPLFSAENKSLCFSFDKCSETFLTNYSHYCDLFGKLCKTIWPKCCS